MKDIGQSRYPPALATWRPLFSLPLTAGGFKLALVAENAELRRQLKALRLQIGREDMTIETGRRIVVDRPAGLGGIDADQGTETAARNPCRPRPPLHGNGQQPDE